MTKTRKSLLELVIMCIYHSNVDSLKEIIKTYDNPSWAPDSFEKKICDLIDVFFKNRKRLIDAVEIKAANLEEGKHEYSYQLDEFTIHADITCFYDENVLSFDYDYNITFTNEFLNQ